MTTAPFSATGNQLVAHAIRQAKPDVMAAYPITPQTTIVETFAKFVADGIVHTQFVTVESEHSAMSSCIGASAAGARVATATSSQGLELMLEEMSIASGMRCPIVMANANRTVSAPINIHADHSDVMSARDSGWIIFFAETAQEAYDNTIVSFKVAEDRRVLLPCMPTLDGFVTTHAMDRCVMEDDDVVARFVGDYEPLFPLLNTDRPVGHGFYANIGDTYMKTKIQTRRAIEGALDVIEEHGRAWQEITGRPFDVVDAWECEDAEYIIVSMGAMAGNARHAARRMRAQGKKVGVVKPRVFRPFPARQIVDACKGVRAIAVFDRSDSMGAVDGPLSAEVKAALYSAAVTVPVQDYIVGLGGADVTIPQIEGVIDDLEAGKVSGTMKYLGIEE